MTRFFLPFPLPDLPDNGPEKSQFFISSIYWITSRAFPKDQEEIRSLLGNPVLWEEDSPISKMVRNLIDRRSPDRLRNFLRQDDPFGRLYQRLFSQKSRRGRGEFFTPGWLTELLAEKTLSGHHPAGSLPLTLDPSCGSGNFLLAVRKEWRKAGIPEEKIVRHLAGFDVNPLSVLSARANWVVRILEESRDNSRPSVPLPEGPLPIFLYDSIAGSVPIIGGVDHSIPSRPRTESPFRPPFDRKADLLIGNPPWIRWDALTPEERKRTEPLWKDYGFFHLNATQARMGGGKKEWAGLFLYVVADRFLKKGGTAGMVIPLSLLQSGLSGEGFRRLILPDGDSLALRWIGDFSHFSPFSGVGTTVGALLFQKGEKTRWPVEVLRCERIPRLEIANRPPSDKFPRIDGKPVRQIPLQAEPSDRSKPESALRFFDPKKRETPFPASREVDRDVYPPIPDSTEDSPYVARLGVNAAGGGGVFWLRPEGPEPEGDYSGLIRVRNLADVGKRKVPEVVAELESTLLYPLVRWRDVDRFRVKSSGLILLPQDPLTRRGIPMEVMATRYPRTLAYLEIFRQMLESRAAYRKFQSRAPYWSLYNVCQETLSPIKVVWRRMDLHFRATVLLPDAKGRPLLPQETLAFVAVETIEEADYLAAVLNSPVTRQKLTSFSLAGSKGFGSPGVLPLLGIPRFDPHAPLHRDLADYGKTRRETP